jgi:orotate phosphoribosyltransferase
VKDESAVRRFIPIHILQSPELKMVSLIPSSDKVMEALKRTGAFREGHFVYPTWQTLAILFSDAACVPLLRHGARACCCVKPQISTGARHLQSVAQDCSDQSKLWGIPVAFGVRDALSAEQIYWAEKEDGKRMFRQYVNQGEVNPCIIVDDIIRSGAALEETAHL